MSAHVCEIFSSLYAQLPDDGEEVKRTEGTVLLYETYCPKNGENYQKCNSDHDIIRAGFLYLLAQLFVNVDSEKEHGDQKDHYVHYGLLWISYKLKQLSNKKNGESIGLNEFFTQYIINSDWYENIKEYVKPQMHLVNKDINIEHMIDIYYILKEMCKAFSNDDDNLHNLEDFTNYYKSVISCAEKLKKHSNNDDTETLDQIYLDLYDMLNNVYNDFRNDYYKKNHQNSTLSELPKLPEIEEINKPSTLDLDKQDSQDSIDEKSENKDDVTNNEQIDHEQATKQPSLETPPEPPQSDSTEPEKTLENSQRSSDMSQENPPNGQITQDNTQKDSLMKQESIIITIDTEFLYNLFKRRLSSFYSTLTDFGNDIYENVLTGLKGGYSIFINLVSNVKDSIDQLDKEKGTPQSCDNGPKSEDPGNDPPSLNDSSKDPPSPSSSEQPPQIEHIDPQNQKNEDKKEPHSEEKTEDENQKEKTQPPTPIVQEPSDSSTNTTSGQTSEQHRSITDVKEIISERVLSMDIFKGYKSIAFSIIVIAIPGILSIMYKVNKNKATK